MELITITFVDLMETISAEPSLVNLDWSPRQDAGFRSCARRTPRDWTHHQPVLEWANVRFWPKADVRAEGTRATLQ